MASNSNKFLICVPQLHDRIKNRERTRIIGRAVAKMAEMLNADIEVSQETNLLSVWVYYKNGRDEWSPLYSDWDKHLSEADVFTSLTGEIRLLSSKHESPVLRNA